jgi:hypothetical protein
MFKSLLWEDWLGLGLGAWLLASPWTLGFSDDSVAAMNALVMGCVLVLQGLLDVDVHEAVEEWMQVIAGVWLMISPFVLGLTSRVAIIDTIAVGVLVVLLAALALSPLNAAMRQWWDDRPSTG